MTSGSHLTALDKTPGLWEIASSHLVSDNNNAHDDHCDDDNGHDYDGHVGSDHDDIDDGGDLLEDVDLEAVLVAAKEQSIYPGEYKLDIYILYHPDFDDP